MGKAPSGATGRKRTSEVKAPTDWQQAIRDVKASGHGEAPWNKLVALISQMITFWEPPSISSHPEFPSLPSPVHEGRRDVRRALQKAIDVAGDLIKAAEQRCGVGYSEVVDPLRSALHEIWTGAPDHDQDAVLATVQRIAELIESLAALRLPPGEGGAPGTEIDLGTDLFVRAVCCFRAEQGWAVHYDCNGWRSSIATEAQNNLTPEAANARVHLHMPNETSTMIAWCLAEWGCKADPTVIARALRIYGSEVRERGHGPQLEDLIRFPALQNAPSYSNEVNNNLPGKPTTMG